LSRCCSAARQKPLVIRVLVGDAALRRLLAEGKVRRRGYYPHHTDMFSRPARGIAKSSDCRPDKVEKISVPTCRRGSTWANGISKGAGSLPAIRGLPRRYLSRVGQEVGTDTEPRKYRGCRMGFSRRRAMIDPSSRAALQSDREQSVGRDARRKAATPFEICRANPMFA